MLYLVGLGLFDEKDLSVRGLELLKNADEIYAEFYTSFYWGSVERIEKLVGKKITVLSRSDVEEHPQENILADAACKDVCFLVCGDPMVATTHIDLVLRARKQGITTKVIHSSSVYSAVGETGLQIYKFGKTTTLALPEKGFKPTSPYDVIAENKERGLHTLVLLDVKAEEKKYMTVAEGVKLLLEMEKEKNKGAFTEETLCVGVARLGGDEKIMYCSAKKFASIDFGPPPHIIIVPGKLHYMEEETLQFYA
jgi:diphthine synthase